MNEMDLKEILGEHRKFLYDNSTGARASLCRADLCRADLCRADLRGANLSEADLREADLRGANLSWADLRGADLCRADLRGANLSEADLRGANLSEANLSGANLSEANLGGANLSGANLSWADLRGADLREADLRDTCLDSQLLKLQREFCHQCSPSKRGGRIVYRTRRSQHIGCTEYKPGRTYVAPHVSADIVTDCHPGIYAASLKWMLRHYPNEALVRCYVRDGDWFITAKGAIRCKRLRILDLCH